jgi:hypothetical protein
LQQELGPRPLQAGPALRDYRRRAMLRVLPGDAGFVTWQVALRQFLIEVEKVVRVALNNADDDEVDDWWDNMRGQFPIDFQEI